jgi:hypothetical protein
MADECLSKDSLHSLLLSVSCLDCWLPFGFNFNKQEKEKERVKGTKEDTRLKKRERKKKKEKQGDLFKSILMQKTKRGKNMNRDV